MSSYANYRNLGTRRHVWKIGRVPLWNIWTRGCVRLVCGLQGGVFFLLDEIVLNRLGCFLCWILCRTFCFDKVVLVVGVLWQVELDRSFVLAAPLVTIKTCLNKIRFKIAKIIKIINIIKITKITKITKINKIFKTCFTLTSCTSTSLPTAFFASTALVAVKRVVESRKVAVRRSSDKKEMKVFV